MVFPKQGEASVVSDSIQEDASATPTASDTTAVALAAPVIDKSAVIPAATESSFDTSAQNAEIAPNAEETSPAVSLTANLDTTDAVTVSDTSSVSPEANLADRASASSEQYLRHTVQSGQTLWQLADAYQVDLSLIASANGLSANSNLKVGQVLRIPVVAGMNQAPDFSTLSLDVALKAIPEAESPAIATESLSLEMAKRPETGATQLRTAYVAPLLSSEPDTVAAIPADVPAVFPVTRAASSPRVSANWQRYQNQATSAGSSEQVTHRIEPGETLLMIATRYGVTLDQLTDANQIYDPNYIFPGQELVLPVNQANQASVAQPIAARPSTSLGASFSASVVAPQNPSVAAPADRVASLSRRDQASLATVTPIEESTTEATVSTNANDANSVMPHSAPRLTAAVVGVESTQLEPQSAPMLVTPAPMQQASVQGVAESASASVNTSSANTGSANTYVESLRNDISRLRSRYRSNDSTESTEWVGTTAAATATTTTEQAARSTVAEPSIVSSAASSVVTPVATPRDVQLVARLGSPDDSEVASARVNPELAVRETITQGFRDRELELKPKASQVAAVPAATSLNATMSRDGDAIASATPAPTAAPEVAVAPLGAANYAPILPPRSVSPEIPALSSSATAYLPNAAPEFNGYIWPAQGMLSSGFGWRWGRMHNGIDIAAPTGTPIVAAAPGVVTYARWNSGGYGNLVEITHPDGSLTLYAHNERILVQEGEQVEQGQHISDMGSTGFSTGPHLHFEIHPAGQGAINPVALLP